MTTPTILLTAALCLVTVALLTRQLWWPSRAEANAAKAAPSSRTMMLGLAVFVVAVAGLGSYWLGTPSPNGKAALSGEGSEAERALAAQQQVTEMVTQLEERVKQHPDDAQALQMLARAYVLVGRNADAVEALRKAAALRPADADVLADLAAALATADLHSLQGEAMQLVERSLSIDPKQVKALSLTGTAAFIAKDYARAVTAWEKVAQIVPTDSPVALQLQSGLAEARRLGNLPPAAQTATAKPVAGGASASSTAAAARISGTVSLSPALKNKASPDDTVFIFARRADTGAESSRMPLAILRKQVKDLPLQFTLDDSLAMSPAAALSSASRVVVGARVSKSGKATPQAGDLQGLTPPTAVGTTGLKIEIGELVTQ